ncbi:endonuclease domain-containing protein [Sphaerisporangium fuscum]|uniref:endonuclease domain-containing protein n=1 Tax=Sphaerisporangium fuscum TaxID=2835868 RepID=UPI001BDCF43A|nr:endonuclease domain-containing protein [Sphaerisporangium fuscum]
MRPSKERYAFQQYDLFLQAAAGSLLPGTSRQAAVNGERGARSSGGDGRRIGVGSDEEQQGRCAICAAPEGGTTSQGTTRRIAVDHDGEGETLRVRGLLCAGCNTGLGAFDHDPERMERAAAYLEQFLD